MLMPSVHAWFAHGNECELFILFYQWISQTPQEHVLSEDQTLSTIAEQQGFVRPTVSSVIVGRINICMYYTKL